MDAPYILKAMLDNEELMEKHKYSPRDIQDISFEPPHDNGFIQFMQSAVMIMDEYQDETPRIMANRLIKFFEENYAL
jgi:hypothetical protein